MARQSRMAGRWAGQIDKPLGNSVADIQAGEEIRPANAA